jgi:hypothetical protein
MTIHITLNLTQISAAEMQPILEIYARAIKEHDLIDPTTAETVECEINLGVDPTLPVESFQITGDPCQIQILGGDRLGLLYGVGKFLRTSRREDGHFIPSEWRGLSQPQKEVRGIYFATHFHNFYQDAPVDKVSQYIQDIALWGFNTLSVWFDLHTYHGINDPAAQAMITRLRQLLQAARAIGLKTSLTLLANEAFTNSPESLRAEWSAGQNGYFQEPGGHYHVELCPHKPGAIELLFRWRRQVFAAFRDTPFDYIWIWPYDQGGCTCARCAPWGTNGFLKLARPIAEVAREYFPQVRIVLSTWYFDHFIKGEWQGLQKFLKKPADWLTERDFLMAELISGGYPDFLVKHGVPGGMRLLGFPEISMQSATPWGGFGANPLPGLVQRLMEASNPLQAGGFPYSEGIFEDLNKALCAQLYWDPNAQAESILKEYIAYEFSPTIVEEAWQALQLLEKTLPRHRMDAAGFIEDYPSPASSSPEQPRFVLQHPEAAGLAWQKLQEMDTSLPRWARLSWRWRILYLRGLIDHELVQNQFAISETCEQAFHELIEIYHAQYADYVVSPPTHESIKASRGG